MKRPDLTGTCVEALNQRRARHANFRGKRGNRPWVVRAVCRIGARSYVTHPPTLMNPWSAGEYCQQIDVVSSTNAQTTVVPHRGLIAP